MKTETLPANIARVPGRSSLWGLCTPLPKKTSWRRPLPSVMVTSRRWPLPRGALAEAKVCRRASATWATTVTCSSIGQVGEVGELARAPRICADSGAAGRRRCAGRGARPSPSRWRGRAPSSVVLPVRARDPLHTTALTLPYTSSEIRWSDGSFRALGWRAPAIPSRSPPHRDRPTPRRRQIPPHRRCDDGLPDLTVIPGTSPQSPHTFQVDLRGLVDLLSHHLYSSPRVYLRELLQNAVDAITARRAERARRPGAGAAVRRGRRAARRGLRHRADRGRRAQPARHDRPQLQARRRPPGGPLGVPRPVRHRPAGLLRGRRRIRVVSRSARRRTRRPWSGRPRDDGSYTVRTLPARGARPSRAPPCTWWRAPGAEQWLDRGAGRWHWPGDFGSLLPYDVRVGDDGRSPTCRPPWDRPYPTPAARRVALARHCHDLFGFTPLDSIDLDVPLAGIRGVAYVLPGAVSPAQRGGPPGVPQGHAAHRAGRRAAARLGVLRALRARHRQRCGPPPRARRCTRTRRWPPSARRSGDRIRGWLTGLAAGDPERLARVPVACTTWA